MKKTLSTYLLIGCLSVLVSSVLPMVASAQSIQSISDANPEFDFSRFPFLSSEYGIGYLPAVDLPNSRGGIDTLGMAIEHVEDPTQNIFQILYYVPLDTVPPKGTRAAFDVNNSVLTLPRIDIMHDGVLHCYTVRFSVYNNSEGEEYMRLLDYNVLTEDEVKALDAFFLPPSDNANDTAVPAEAIKPEIQQSPVGLGWDDVYTLPAIDSREFYRPVTRDFELLELNFNRSNMPVRPVYVGDTLMIRAVLPPGVSYAAISGESNDWQGTVAGTYPVMTTTDENPGEFCVANNLENCTGPADMSPTTASLNRILYGNASPHHPVREEASEVYFVLYNPPGSKADVNFGSLRLVMLVADKALYEVWRNTYLP